MKSFETWRTWIIVIGLLLFSGLAVVTLPWLAQQFEPGAGDVELSAAGEVEVEEEYVTIDLEDYLLGEVLVDAPLIKRLNGVQVHPLVLTAILAVISFGALLAMGIPLAFIYVRLEQETEELKEDPDFQAAQAELDKREQERIKQLEEEQPPKPVPEHEMPRWSTISTALVILMFVGFAGLVLSDSFFPEVGEVEFFAGSLIDPGVPLTGTLMLLALLVLIAITTRPRHTGNAEAKEENTDYQPIPWGTIWVIISGLIFLGIGTGLVLAIRSAGGG